MKLDYFKKCFITKSIKFHAISLRSRDISKISDAVKTLQRDLSNYIILITYRHYFPNLSQMTLQFKPDIITDFLQWMQELGYYIYLHLTLSDGLSEAASSFGFKATGD